MVKAKVVCMFKNEADILEDWIRYHLAIFGDGNVHLINDHSTDGSSAILKRYEKRITIDTAIVDAPSYKSENTSRIMARYKNECDLLIPIDADEFISLQNSSDPAAIRAALEQLDTKRYGRFKFHFNYSAIPRAEEPADPLTEIHDFEVTCFDFLAGGCYHFNKSFYAAESFVLTDGGNHNGFTLNESTFFTDLWLVTFPIRTRQQFEMKLVQGALHLNFWNRSPSECWHWRQGYDALRSGKFEEHYLFWTNQAPDTRRTFFAEQIKKLRAPEPARPPAPDPVAACFTELAQLNTRLSDLLCNWVWSKPASHPCFDLEEHQDARWQKFAHDTDAILRYGMLRRYNPARFMQLGEPTLLPGVDEAITPTQLRTQALTPLASAVPTLARTLQPGDFVSLETLADLTALLPQLPSRTIVELRKPDAPLPARLEPIIPRNELDVRSWELLFGTAALSELSPTLPRALWLRVD